MPDFFTERADETVLLATEEAHSFQHDYVGTEHFLLAILRVKPRHADAPDALATLDVTYEAAREEVARIVGYGTCTDEGNLPYTPRAEAILHRSRRAALSLGHASFIDAEHILISLVRENESVAVRILYDFGADPRKVRRAAYVKLARPILSH